MVLKGLSRNDIRLANLQVYQEQDLPGASARVAVLSIHSGVDMVCGWYEIRQRHEGGRGGRISRVRGFSLSTQIL
jgi:hypothetical protein